MLAETLRSVVGPGIARYFRLYTTQFLRYIYNRTIINMIVISKEYSNLYHNRLTVIAAHKLDEDILTGHVVVLR